MRKTKITLSTIVESYSHVDFNEDNYYIGGGISCNKFVSKRHEDARNDVGKLTLGEATQLFKKATGLDVALIKNIIMFAIPNMEWHHAGKIPKRYGGGMNKTYFLNSKQIVDIATNFDNYKRNYELFELQKEKKEDYRKQLENRKLEFLKSNAIYRERIINKPSYFYETKREMKGKFGWFDCLDKHYNLPIHYSGYEFENEEILNEFFNLK